MSDNAEVAERWRKLKQLYRGPLIVWLVLIALIGLTTWLGYMPLDHENVAANYPIAALMVGLVAFYLMRLKEAAGTVWIAGLCGVYFLFMLFLLVFADYFNR